MTHYYGTPCGRSPSHGTKRYTNSGNCVQCDALKNKTKRPPKVKGVPVQEPYTPEQEERLHTGALKFFGYPCRRGHDGLRYARDGSCVDCAKESATAYRPPRGLSRVERAKWLRHSRMERIALRQAAERKAMAKQTAPRQGLDPVTEVLFFAAMAC